MSSRFFISSRASCDIDVSAVCAKMGGGGHLRAAGASLVCPDPVSAFNECVALFEEAVNNYKAR